MKKNNMSVTILIIVVVGAFAFYGGIQYQKSQRGNFTGGQFANRNGEQVNNRPVNGEIISQDDTSITVKMQDGSSKIVILSDKTSINKAAQGTKADLKTGEKVAVFGQNNSDGSVTAQSIQINPMFRTGQGGSRPTQ